MKKIICLFLVLTLAISVSVTAFAESTHCDCDAIPIISVPGIGGELWLNYGTENAKVVYPPESQDIVKSCLQLIPAIAVSIVTKSWDAVGDSVIDVFGAIFSETRCDENGNSVNNISCEAYSVKPGQNHKENRHYKFRYDWRLDFMETADKLNVFINEVCRVTGHEKVIVNSQSEGGLVLMAYLQKYGTEKLDTFVMFNSAFQGFSMVGRLFNGDVGFDSFLLANYPSQLIKDDSLAFVDPLVKVLYKVGVLDWLISYLDIVVENLKDRLYDEGFIPMLATWPALWGFVPDEYFDGAVEYIFKGDSKYDVLKDKVTYYHDNVMVKAKELLEGAKADGVKVAIVGNYNLSGQPFTKNEYYHTDGLIDTRYTSGGATVALYGSTLGENYVQQNTNCSCGKNHLSSDGIIDASTCMLPENTWFIKNFSHWQSNKGYDELGDWLFNFDGQPTVFDSADFPQFLEAVGDDIVPLGSVEESEDVASTLLDLILSYIPTLLG